MTNPITAAIAAMVEEFETGLAVAPRPEVLGTLAPSGEIYRTFVYGRMLEDTKITDEILIKRMTSDLRQYKKAGVNAGGKTVHWRERPDFGTDFCNSHTKTLKCRVAISTKELAPC